MTEPLPPGATPAVDAERDAWLHHALRHAPDAELDAPAAISDAILREARSAVRSGAGERSRGATAPHRVGAAQVGRTSRRRGLARLADLWAALARPPVAASMASLILATLVGMLWWDRPLGDITNGASPVADATGVVPAARAPAPAAPWQPTVQDANPERSADRRPAQEEPPAPVGAPPMRVQRFGQEARLGASPGETKALSRPEPEDSVGRRALPAPVPSAQLRPPPVPPSAKAGPALPPPSPPAPHPRLSAPVPSDDRPETEAANGPSRSTRGLTESRGERGTPQPPRAAPTPEAAGTPRLEAAPPAAPLAPFAGQERASRGAPGASPSAAPSAAASPLGALRNAIASEPQRWTWARARAHGQPTDAAILGWLARVDAARNAAWFEVPGSSSGRLRETLRPGSALPAENADDAAIQVFRDGRLAATLRLGAGAVELAISPAAGVAAEPRRWRAPLAPERAGALQTGLP